MQLLPMTIRGLLLVEGHAPDQLYWTLNQLWDPLDQQLQGDQQLQEDLQLQSLTGEARKSKQVIANSYVSRPLTEEIRDPRPMLPLA